MSESNRPSPTIGAELEAAVAERSSLRHVAHELALAAQALLGAEGASVQRRELKELVYIAGVGVAEGVVGYSAKIDESMSGEVFRDGQGRMFIPRWAARPGTVARAMVRRIRSGLVVRVEACGKPIGTLGVCSSQKYAFTFEDLAALDELARTVSARLTD